MSAKYSYQDHPDPVILHLTVGEHFDYRSIHTFRNLYTEKLDCDAHVIIDMSSTRYADSSGVALIQCLQQWIKAPMVIIKIVNCRPNIRLLLTQAQLPSIYLLINVFLN